jgi:dipeptidyl aminopeptidase/acylaminoacyl peptidase
MNKAISLVLSLALPAASQTPPRLQLTVDSIMRGPALYGYEPRSVRWSGDGSRLYFQWKEHSAPREKPYDTWVVLRNGAGLRKLSETEARSAPSANAVESEDGTKYVYTDDGDLFLHDARSNETRRLTRTGDAEFSPRFTRDGRRVAFQRAGNLYTLSLDGGFIEQWTDIRPAGSVDPDAPPKGTESQEALRKEERSLLETVDRRARQREEERARRKKDNPRKPFILAARQSVSSLRLSPDESYVVAVFNEPAAQSKQASVPAFVTETGYTENSSTRTKVGDQQSRNRLAFISTSTGEVKWADTGLKTTRGDKEVPRELNLFNPQWSPDGSRLVFAGRSEDFKDRWIFKADPVKGELRPLFNLREEAWVGGPGAMTLGWLADNESVYFIAERDGWAHLHTAGWTSGEVKQLTSGKWEVESATLSKDKRQFRLVTSESSLAERHVYLLPAEGGARTRLTSEPGNHEPVFSHDGSMLALVHSYTNHPPELYLMEARAGAPMKRVTSSPAPEFAAYPWMDAPVVEVPARDGARVPARLYKPRDQKPGGPAVIFVHGAGYLQNAHKWWSNYAREYMFHHLLVERGYTVIDLDYRASAGYGRNWRTAIYRHMGGKDLDDQVDAARWLVSAHGVDPLRIGIYGGSYGGFITLMAMFTQPGVFAAGAALRPVTDWAHYNHPYAGGILNLPQSDAEAYKRSSPIYHAAGLKGALLICHGMVDVNVHFQDTVRLAQKLIELRKENWEVAIYPVEDHAFVEETSWADEYKRILKLFETNLK